MKRTYRCIRCHAVLNPASHIVLVAEVATTKALMLFSPQPGNYEVVLPQGLELAPLQTVTFRCPVCARDLTSSRDEGMAEIEYFASGREQGVVAFSRTYGRRATYFITKEAVHSYGEHADPQGVNFWGVGPGREAR